MILNREIILKIGFKTDHPERSLGNYELNEFGKYKIYIISQYKPMSNTIEFNCDCNKLNNNGIVVKRGYLSAIKTTEELQKIIDLCEIDFKIDSKYLS